MDEYYEMLLEEQFLSRLKNTLVSTDQYLTHKLKENKYDVEANKKRPLVRQDIKYLSGVLAGMSKEILAHVQKRYHYEFKSIQIKEQVRSEEGDIQRTEVHEPEGGPILHVVGPDENSEPTQPKGSGS